MSEKDIMDMRMSILKAIEHDGRVDLNELAIRLGLDATDVANAMADLENEGII